MQTYQEMLIADVKERNSRHKNKKPIPRIAVDAIVTMHQVTQEAWRAVFSKQHDPHFEAKKARRKIQAASRKRNRR